MNWHDTVDIATFNDAWRTWDTYFRKDKYPSLRFKEFYTLVLQNKVSKYEMLSISNIRKMGLDNFSLEKLSKSNSEDMFPPDDRPRGKKDIESVDYHSQTDSSTSPIIIIKIKSKYILLDGQHRILAAKLAKSKVCVCFVKV